MKTLAKCFGTVALVSVSVAIAACSGGAHHVNEPSGIVKIGFITEPGCEERAKVAVLIEKDASVCSVGDLSHNAPVSMPCNEVGRYIRKTFQLQRSEIVSTKFAWEVTAEEYLARAASLEALHVGLAAAGFEAGGTGCYVSRSDHGDR